MRGTWAGVVGLSLIVLIARAAADDWRTPAPGPSPAIGVTLGRPQGISLGRPQPMDDAGPIGDPRLIAVSYPGTDAPPPVVRGQSADWTPLGPPVPPVLGAPQPPSTLVTSTSRAPGDPYVYPTPPATPPPLPPAPPGLPPGGLPPPPPGLPGAPPVNPIPPVGGAPRGGLFGNEWMGSTTGTGRKMFQSDPCFESFISPVSNPFLFEDPRSLTEVRPILIYEHTPNSNPVYAGGNLWFLGTQARLAVTERLSFVMNKFGMDWSDPNHNPGEFGTHFGFSEIWLGPKYTFLRNEQTGTLAAGGVTFQLPVGDKDVFQNTGWLTVSPYLSFGQQFLKDFHFLTTMGYAFGDHSRTDYFYNSYHLDYDVGGLHRIYPLVELNWVRYTNAGGSQALNFEGRDLINFGSTMITGTNSLTFAIGARYKFMGCDNIQTGLAMEFPLIASKDLLNFRVTWDFILRY